MYRSFISRVNLVNILVLLLLQNCAKKEHLPDKGVVNGNNVVLRTQPNLDESSKSGYVLSLGETITVIDKSTHTDIATIRGKEVEGHWLKVQSQKGNGWVFEALVDIGTNMMHKEKIHSCDTEESDLFYIKDWEERFMINTSLTKFVCDGKEIPVQIVFPEQFDRFGGEEIVEYCHLKPEEVIKIFGKYPVPGYEENRFLTQWYFYSNQEPISAPNNIEITLLYLDWGADLYYLTFNNCGVLLNYHKIFICKADAGDVISVESEILKNRTVITRDFEMHDEEGNDSTVINKVYSVTDEGSFKLISSEKIY